MSFKSRPALKDSNLLFFDCETSGLSPSDNEILEVACILTDPTGQYVLKEYCAKVLPTKEVSEKVAALNGYDKEKWATEAVSLSTAMKEILLMARDAVLVGHNVSFDWAFLEEAMRKNAQRFPGFYHRADTLGMAWPLLKHGLVPNVKLSTLTQHFNVPHDQAHTALADARACREVYLKLMSLINLK